MPASAAYPAGYTHEQAQQAWMQYYKAMQAYTAGQVGRPLPVLEACMHRSLINSCFRRGVLIRRR